MNNVLVDFASKAGSKMRSSGPGPSRLYRVPASRGDGGSCSREARVLGPAQNRELLDRFVKARVTVFASSAASAHHRPAATVLDLCGIFAMKFGGMHLPSPLPTSSPHGKVSAVTEGTGTVVT